jgi:TRAP-type C4-dicarboxylate transport system permease small subunit
MPNFIEHRNRGFHDKGGILLKVFKLLNDIMVFLAAILLWVMLGITIYGIFFRRSGLPVAWVIEISEYSLLYIIFLVTTNALIQDGHVKIDFILDRLGSKAQSIIGLITSVLAGFTCCVLTWYGITVTLDSFVKKIPTIMYLKIPKFIVLMIIPVGFCLLTIQFTRRTCTYINALRSYDRKNNSDKSLELTNSQRP